MTFDPRPQKSNQSILMLFTWVFDVEFTEMYSSHDNYVCVCVGVCVLVQGYKQEHLGTPRIKTFRLLETDFSPSSDST